jgi:hypothetical protein
MRLPTIKRYTHDTYSNPILSILKTCVRFQQGMLIDLGNDHVRDNFGEASESTECSCLCIFYTRVRSSEY